MAVELFVNGTLMRGLALHHNLDGAEFLGEFRTAPVYRLYSIGDVHPGMFEVAAGGVSVGWSAASSAFAPPGTSTTAIAPSVAARRARRVGTSYIPISASRRPCSTADCSAA